MLERGLRAHVDSRVPCCFHYRQIPFEDKGGLSFEESVQNLSVGRSVKHTKGTSAYTVQVRRGSSGGPTQLYVSSVG